jgi:hypothetical protein
MRYRESGLSILGVHTPEFKFARDPAQVKAAVGRLGIMWPVVLVNNQRIWKSFANRSRPTLYLIDQDGYLRYRHMGEGGYAQTESAIHALLKTLNPKLELPNLINPIRPEDGPGAVCHPTTPELHIHALGNSTLPSNNPTLLEIPAVRRAGQFYLNGWWKAVDEGVTLASEGGQIVLPYQAASVNGVFAPSSDPGDLAIGFPEPCLLQIRQNGEPLPKNNSTEDLYYENGAARLRIDYARSYALARYDDVVPRELTLEIEGAGFTLYAFSFGSCVVPDSR